LDVKHHDGGRAGGSVGTDNGPDLTILMPCLNEAKTISLCLDKALGFLERAGIEGELLVADNGSTDGSVKIAEDCGARVVHVSKRGYGATLLEGIKQARGTYVIMADSDGSYDFDRLEPFMEKFDEGYELVIGDRFRGGIAPGAMRPLHRYVGNPILSLVGRLFFPTGVSDFHCGLRGCRRESALSLGLSMSGMEFASEMIVRASLRGLKIAEVPTTLSPDGRSRPPHLRTWRDGWRHLRFLLLFCPRWLFLYPGLAILAFGAVVTALLLPGPVSVAPGVTLDIHTLIIGCLALLVGTQCVSFALISRRYAAKRGFLPVPQYGRFWSLFSLERFLLAAALLMILGIGGIAYSVFFWASADFGPLAYPALLRTMTVSSTLVALGIQVGLAAFLSELLDIDG
jgi:glycosyltransferase involved in cell wall biosynthesis